MNRDCCGEFFTVEGQKLYRCFLDSTIVVADELDRGSKCPHCKRLISSLDKYDFGEVPTVTRRFVVLPIDEGLELEITPEMFPKSSAKE